MNVTAFFIGEKMKHFKTSEDCSFVQWEFNHKNSGGSKNECICTKIER